MKHTWERTVFTTDDPEINLDGWVCTTCGNETIEEFELEDDDCGADHE